MRTLLSVPQYQELCRRYAEPHRHYHTLDHITIMFQLAAAHGIRLSVPQQLAIWFHDVVYEPKAQKGVSENLSVDVMREILGPDFWVTPEHIDRTSRIIIATVHHKSADHETQTVLDLDLAALGFDSESYALATQQLRAEYEHMSDLRWTAQRGQFLAELLSREHIFHTPWGRDCYEKKARQNIEAELNGNLF